MQLPGLSYFMMVLFWLKKAWANACFTQSSWNSHAWLHLINRKINILPEVSSKFWNRAFYTGVHFLLRIVYASSNLWDLHQRFMDFSSCWAQDNFNSATVAFSKMKISSRSVTSACYDLSRYVCLSVCR